MHIIASNNQKSFHSSSKGKNSEIAMIQFGLNVSATSSLIVTLSSLSLYKTMITILQLWPVLTILFASVQPQLACAYACQDTVLSRLTFKSHLFSPLPEGNSISVN